MKKSKDKSIIKKFKWLFICFFAILIIIAFLVFCPYFNILSIEVMGNNYYSEDVIVYSSNIEYNTNGFKLISGDFNQLIALRYANIEKEIEKLSYIEEAIVEYKPPSTIKINITERSKCAYIKYFGSILIIDKSGYIIDVVSEDEISSLIEIKGTIFNDYILGQVLTIENEYSLENAIKVIKTVEKSDSTSPNILYDHIDWIDVSEKDNIKISLDDRILVKLGDIRDISYRIEFLKQIFFKGISTKDRGVLDFTKGENPGFIPEN